MNEKVLKTLEYDKIIGQLSRHASSDAGKRLCEKLLPMTDKDEIQTAQTQTSDAVLRLRRKPGPSYNGLKNIIPSLKRLDIGGILSCQDLLEISAVLDIAASAKNFLRPENEEELPDSLSVFYAGLEPCHPLNAEIKRCILGYDEVADDASPTLKDIRRKMISTNSRIQQTLNSLVTSNAMKTYLQDAVVTTRGGRYCIPVKLEHKNHVPGMVHDQSSSGSTVFIEPMSVVKLNNELKELELQEEAEIQIILSKLSFSASLDSEHLEKDYKLLVDLDFILAKARYSESLKANAPSFNAYGVIDLRQARHPLIDASKVVPISLELGRDFTMLVVTGPNTGGKTVSLKTVGLLTLMGQAGLHIPALDGSSLAIFNEVYADIGDEQSIEQNLSTFSSHMTNLVRILDKADSESLVLLDELCSGTDPTEGAALAQEILVRLHNFGTRCMATTHYAELKVFAIQTPGVQNACCEFDVETLRPTYKLLIGLPGKSNAFAISGKLGLDERIIEGAKARIDTGNTAFEDLLADIETDRKSAELDRAEAAKMKAEAEELRKKFEKDLSSLDSVRDSILSDARSEAYDILQQAKTQADTIIKDIRRNSKSADLSGLERVRTEAGKKAKAALENMGSLKKDNSRSSSLKLSEDDIEEGMPVRIRSMNMIGTVVSLPDSKKQVGVQMGSMNMKVAVSDLMRLTEDELALQESAGSKGRLQKTGMGHLKYSKSLGVGTELKLIGMNTDDAMLELDKYLDDACMAHIPSARIVHGKGAGILRQAVQNKLKKDKRVRSFRQAEYGEGDAGVTIVEFR